MSIDISAYTGFFIKAKRVRVPCHGVETVCPTHGKMNTMFCSKCGAAAIQKPISGTYLSSISEVISDPDCPWVAKLSPADVLYIQRNTGFIEPYEIQANEGYDHFLIGKRAAVIRGWGGSKVVNLDKIVPPSQSMIDRIVKAVGYKDYKLHFGTLLCVNS